MDYNGTVSFTCTGAPLGATCKAPTSVTLNTGTPASFTVMVPTSGGALIFPDISARRPPHAPALPTILTVTFGTLFCILVLILNGDAAGGPLNARSNPSRWKAAYAMAALILCIPVILAMEGCGGGATSAPVAQGNSLVTPSGTSTLVLTPTAVSVSGKALQLPPIELTLTVN